MFKYIICIYFSLGVANSSFDYGEFDLTLTRIELCKGPKRRNCIEASATQVDDVSLKFDFFVIENMSTIKGKIMGHLNNQEIVRLQIKNMCDHIFFKPMLQAMFNETTRCGVFKGHYKFGADTQNIARALTGGKFMYGNWTFKSTFYNDKCNMHCDTIEMMISPKKTSVNETAKMRSKLVYSE